MDVIKSLDRFYLNNDTTLDQQVGNKISNQDILVPNFDPVLLSDLKANLPELDSQRVFINLLKKPGAQCIADLMNTGDDLLGDFIEN